MTIPCPLCGYHAPEDDCPHCHRAPNIRSLARPLSGPLGGVLDGLMAVPMGLWLLITTRGTKRWLVPPFLLTLSLLVLLLWWVFGWFSDLIDSVLPGDISLADGEWTWLEGLSERWDWAKATWGAVVGSLEWVVNALYGMLTSQPLRLLGYFLVGSLVVWYCFSIAYEALAGPFLDEVHGRLEKRWFGADPRSRLERPNDIPGERCFRLSLLAGLVALVLLLVGIFVPGVPFWLCLLATPLSFLVASWRDREYGEWLRWMVRIETKAVWVSLQAAFLTGVILLFALPLFFVPFGVGYVLFACVTGFATAVGLLDIPLERRGLRLRQRLAFLFHNLLPFIAFGIVSGLLLAVPFVGPALMVPAASVGGLWLICRLDKSGMRPSASGPGVEPDRPAA